MSRAKTGSHSIRVDLSDLDLKILAEMQLDGRQPVSVLARKLGISRVYASNRLKRLLHHKTARITAYTNPLALGYRCMGITGIQVSLGQAYTVAQSLRNIPEVTLVWIVTGSQDILIWSMFPNALDLMTFLSRDLGGISGIRSAETMMVVEWRACFSYVTSRQWMSYVFSYPASASLLAPVKPPQEKAFLNQEGDRVPDLSIDLLDLMILKEIEQNGRQPLKQMARKTGVSWDTASARLQYLLDQKVTRIGAYVDPLAVGYPALAFTGAKVSLKDIDAVMDKLQALSHVIWIAKVTGRYDVIFGAGLPDMISLSHFLTEAVGCIPGILSVETMVGLELTKQSFGYLASSHLQRIEQCQQET
jgi:DNA-binding Lrp family transcriptional regulator